MKTLTIILIVFAVPCVAQTPVSGLVTTEKGDTLTGANIYISGSFDGATSGIDGRFSFITARSGDHVLTATLLGFEPFSAAVKLNGVPVTIHAVLKEKANELNAVTITAGTFEAGDAKKMSVLNSIDIATTAGATADITGALKTLPGVQPSSQHNGLFVRGGDAHESAVYFDGMLVKNLYTGELPDIASRGRFSPFMFKGTSFTTGAYTAQFGNALSSTMSLESKDLPEKTKSDIGIMSAGIDATHVRRFPGSSLELNAGYFNLKPVNAVVKQTTHWLKSPEAINANGFYKAKTSDNGMLKIYINYEKETAGIRMDNADDISRLSDYTIRSQSLYVNSTWQQYINNSWKLNAGIACGSDKGRIRIDEDDVVKEEQSSHVHLSGTHYFGTASSVKSGVDLFRIDKGESFNILHHSFQYGLMAVFAEGSFQIGKRFAFRPGIRHELLFNSESLLSPRIACGWMVNEQSQVSLGFGTFYQMPADEYLFGETAAGPERAMHYVLNYQFGKEDRMFRTEVYLKSYDDLVKSNGGEIANTGYGYARGIDVFFRDRKSVKYADFWISYSFLDTKRNYKDYPSLAAPSFAARHVANMAGKYFIAAASTSVGLTYTYASGRPYYNPLNEVFHGDYTKDYHSVSINVSYLTSIGRQFTILYLSVENIFGINNIYGYRFSADGTARKPITPSAPCSIFAGMFITFGDNTYR